MTKALKHNFIIIIKFFSLILIILNINTCKQEKTSITENIVTRIQAAENETAVVSRVIDGDTIVLNDGRKVRYIGIDTPETVHPTKSIQCFGKQASIKNKELVLGKTVELEKDVSETDKYGRYLRYVYVDGVMINKQLLSEGYATAVTYPPDIKYHEEFTKAQAQARQAKLGLWGDECSESKSKSTTNDSNSSPTTTENQQKTVNTKTKTTNTQIAKEISSNSNEETSNQHCPSNCSEAQAMGMTNMTPDHPCWQSKFDRDKDGIGCESSSKSGSKSKSKTIINADTQTQNTEPVATPAPTSASTPTSTSVPTPVPTPTPTPEAMVETAVVPEPTPAAPAQTCPNNCTQAKAMGMTNMTPDHPCWQSKFDRDKDGIGCEN